MVSPRSKLMCYVVVANSNVLQTYEGMVPCARATAAGIGGGRQGVR